MKAKFTVATPHHYLLNLSTDLSSRFKDSSAKLSDVKLSADLECNENTKSYPTNFSVKGKYSDLAALSLGVTSEKALTLIANADIFFRLYGDVYGSG